MIRRHTISFRHAFNGIAHACIHQPNLRIHFVFSLIAIVMGLYLQINYLEWIIILFTVMWVILSEMINTAIEAVVDLVTEEKHMKAKIAKDTAAGAVLIGALGSIIVGGAIFIPRILEKL